VSEFWKVSLFWAGMAAMIVVALAFVLPPLLRGGAAKRAALALALLVPGVAIALYAWLGSPDALLAPRASVAQQQAQDVPGGHDVAGLIASLEAKLKTTPDDVAGWLMLARSYAAMERYVEAGRAFEQVARIDPKDARGWSGLAEVVAVTQGHKMEGRPASLVRKALDLNPDDEKGLELAGITEYQSGNFAQAAFYWRRLVKLLPADSDYARELDSAARQAVLMAEEASGLKAAVPKQDAPMDNLSAASTGEKPAGGKAAADAALSGEVRLAPALAARAKPDASVYIFARPAQGRGAPLAVEKVRVKDLPYRFKLTDAMAMTPEAKISDHAQLQVSARVSLGGGAMPASGDLSGSAGPFAPGAGNIAVLIDQVVP
jgi:cytochrome c-type biogenesis protein CcmH